jgi:ABC-2 type transport system ATP-binding protein
MTLVLQARNLAKSFKDVAAVRDLSLEVATGECLALLGPNGAGKTTSVEMLEGIQAPDKGEIVFFGTMRFATHRKEIYKRIGAVLQDTKLYGKYTVRETFDLFRSFYEHGYQLENLLKILELGEKRNTRLENLSGGQRQRVYLGCAIINNPDLVFLDEPTTGLDPAARRNMWEVIRSLKAQGKAIILTTHYMEEAEQLADRIVIIDRGQIVSQGTPQELILKNCGESLLRFSFKSTPTPGLINDLSWLRNAKQLSDLDFEIHDQDCTKLLGSIVTASHAHNIEIARLEVKHPTLEDVFLALTGRSIEDAKSLS